MSKAQADAIRKKFDFRWEALDIILSGRSSIDSREGFHLHSTEDAERFIRSYGYNLENPIEKAEGFGNLHEALAFIRRYFLQPENPDGLRLDIPRKILEIGDLRDLFLFASLNGPGQTGDQAGVLLRDWACAILKVMHTIAHMDQDIRTPHFADIQKQIFDRYYRFIQRDGDGKLYLGERVDDPNRVDLVAFETKPKKARDSTLLKLLHKPENVAEDIFDRVGIRFVTPGRVSILRVLKYLRDKMVFMPPNIKPSRSRNTLIDLERMQVVVREALEKLEQGQIDESAFEQGLEQAASAPQPQGTENPHSSSTYRAIQFTCRQLIKLKNPLFDDLKELKGLSRSKPMHEDLLKIVDRMDLKYLQRELRFFYPYEVQLVDQQSFEQNEKGRSAHSEYKRAQIQTAMRRVMGPLADAAR